MPSTLFDPRALVLWADASLLAVDKPAGLPVLPDGYDPDAPYLKGVLSAAYAPLWIVHRLDRDTSGILVLARTAESHRLLNDQFASRAVSKIYHALVMGAPSWEAKTVRVSLRPDGDRKHRTVVDPRHGKPSVTQFRMLERFARYALIEAAPQTGRTHQIRAHLSAIGYPIIADVLYGGGNGLKLSDFKPGYRPGASEKSPLLGRLGLHAWSLTLRHPFSGEELRFEAPYPKDFSVVLKQLRKYGGNY